MAALRVSGGSILFWEENWESEITRSEFLLVALFIISLYGVKKEEFLEIILLFCLEYEL